MDMKVTDLPPQLPQDLISIYDIMFMFDVRYLTILNWRNHHALPFHVVPGTMKSPAIRYSLDEVTSWAAQRARIQRMGAFQSGKFRFGGKLAKEFAEFLKTTKL